MTIFSLEELRASIAKQKADGTWDDVVKKFEEQALQFERELEEAGYAGQGHTSGAESFYGTYYGFGGDKQLAAKPTPAVRKLKKQRDAEAPRNFQDQQQSNRGYPAAQSSTGFAGGDGLGGPNSGVRIPNTIAMIGKTPAELDAMYPTDPSKNYWDDDLEDVPPDIELTEPDDVNTDLNEQLGSGAGASGPQRGVASDGNYRDLPGFPRHNTIEKPDEFIPPVEGDVDKDGEEDVYLTDEEYVNDVLRMNGLGVAPGMFKRLFHTDDLSESVEGTPFKLYHGTSTAVLEQIKKTGVIKAPVYLGTEEIADYYAEVVAEEDGSEEVVLAINLSDLDVGALEPDDNSIAEPLTYTLGKSEDEVWEEWKEAEGTWEDSLDIVGSVRYRQPIPLKDVVLLEHGKMVSEGGNYVSPSYDPEPDKPVERYKQGYWEEVPQGDDWLINHVDYSGGHTSLQPAEHSPGAQTYGNIATPKDFVPEDWEQRHPKTKEEPIDMDSLEEMIRKMVAEIIREAYTGIDDETGKGEPEGGSEAFEKNRKEVLDYDEKQKPKGTEDLKNYHMDD